MNTWSRIRSLLAGSALVLAGCSGGGGGSDNPSTPADMSSCPGGSTSTSPSGTLNVSWDAVNTANVAGYRVYYGTMPGVYVQPAGQGLDAGNITAYTVAGLNRGSRYFLAVTAYDAANAESTYSNEVCKVVG